MSTTAIKLGSLAIKTLAKPIASRIKQQAREHPRFRKVCIFVAQRIHQIDVRLRLGLLQDTAAFVKAEQAERDAARQAAKKAMEGAAIYPANLGTVSSVEPVPPPKVFGDPKPHPPPEPVVRRPRVRPLPESKAVESGANFISEFFLFAVAGGLILAEQIRARRKEASRRDVIAERLELLEERTRQDEERLAELEMRSSEDGERIITLEEENWRLKGGKGVFPGRSKVEGKERKVVKPTPLWEEVSEKGAGLWTKIWQFGMKTEDKVGDAAEAVERALVILDEERPPTEHSNSVTNMARSPAVIRKTRPTANPELPASDETVMKTLTPSHLPK